MYKFVIEREIPGVGKMTIDEIRAVSRRSVRVLEGLGADIQWVESFVTGDKIYCVYLATSEELIREHGRLTGIPVNSVEKVTRMIDPTVGASRPDSG
jgi:methionine synthase I (cobalamin-dependent)